MAEVEVAVTDDTGTAEKPADWTILIYLSADNNLSEECIYALKELRECLIEPSGKDFKVKVIALIDPVGRGIKARHIEVGVSGAGGNIDEDTLDEEVFGQLIRGEIDMGEPQTLKDFLRIGIRLYQAENYMVILSGHAAGTHEGFFLRDEERPLSLIPSSLPPQLLEEVFSNDGIKAALKDKKIDILGFDACMMSMIEVCYQLHDIDVLDLVVGSEGFSLNAGWPYDEIVSRLIHCKIKDPVQLAKVIVEENFEFYRDYFVGGLSTDMSIIRLGQLRALKDKVDTLAEMLIAGLKKEEKSQLEETVKEEEKEPYYYYKEDGSDKLQDAVILAHWAAQAYNGEQCVDLYDFCHLLGERLEYLLKELPSKLPKATNQIKEACDEVKKFFDAGKLIELSCYTGAAFQYSHGISIYFPWSKVNMAPNYENFDFGNHKMSAWRRFLNLYVDVTQRRMRKKGKIWLDETRSTPPYGKGPEGKIFSMRNPPAAFDHCFECGDVELPKKCSNYVARDGVIAAAGNGEEINTRAAGARKTRGGKKPKSRK